MSGRTPMECPNGFEWGTLDRGNTRVHLVKSEPWNRDALCGVTVYGDSMTAHGTRDRVCPKCLRIYRDTKGA